MTTNPDRPYHAASFVGDDEVWLRLYRKTSSRGVYLTATDDVAAVSVSFSFNRMSLERLIAALQLESKLLATPEVGERRRASATNPALAGCEAIHVANVYDGWSLAGERARPWFVYCGSLTETWLTTDEVADWGVIE